MMQKEDRASSPIHIFSSHFYTTLSREGTDAVESWTARKNIDIFKKCFIFLPINDRKHWSLCVVVNPAYITGGGTGPFPCILHLDSLKAHSKDTVARHVNKWLNAEWKRLMAPKHGNVKPPFNSTTMAVFAPRSKFLSMPLFLCHYRDQQYCRVLSLAFTYMFQYPIRIRTIPGIVVYSSAATPKHSSCYVKTC